MKIINTYMVLDKVQSSTWKTLFECENGAWFESSNGAFGQRSLYFTCISKEDAQKLIEKTKELIPSHLK